MEFKTKFNLGERVWIIENDDRKNIYVSSDFISEIVITKTGINYFFASFCDDVAEENLIAYNDTKSLVEKIKELDEKNLSDVEE